MNPLNNIEKLISGLVLHGTKSADERIVNDSLAAFEKSKDEKPAETQPNMWRLIIRNRIAKLATAVAVIATILLSITFFNMGTTPAYAITEAFELLRQTNTLHVRGWQLDTYYSDTFDTEISIKKPFEYWYDFENGRYRLDTIDFDGSGKFGWHENLKRDSTICDGEYEMSGNWCWRTTGESWKSIKFEKINKSKTEPSWLKFYGKLDNIEGSTIIDKKESDGIKYDIWEVKVARQVCEDDEVNKYKIQTWISPSTKEIGRIKEWRKEGDGPWIQTVEYSMFERNVALSPDLFVTEPPQGEEYRLVNTKETAIDPSASKEPFDIYDWAKFDYAPIAYRVIIAFRLNNGSFLACWQSIDASEPHDQTKYFQNLEIGSDLPKLPAEVYAFSPSPNVRNMQFIGFHLAYTRKETEKGPRWYEWSLYVPDKEPPSPDRVLHYQIHFRYNTDEDKETSIMQTSFDWKEIETERDFEIFVVEAMAERSNDGHIPEHITYEKILDLSEELSKSLAQQ